VARVLVLIPDLMFGSQVKGQLAADGHEVTWTGYINVARKELMQSPPAVLVIDLGSSDFDGVEFLRDAELADSLVATRTLGFFPHVDAAAWSTRTRTEGAACDQMVTRKRMAREGGTLISRLAGESQ
jgi:hypothetical protein